MKKKLQLIILILGIVSLVGAILLFALAVPNANVAYKRVLEIIMASFMLLVVGLSVLFLYITRSDEPNFFLFDRAKRCNIPVEKLTSQIVNERMSFFLSTVCDSADQLWNEGVLENDLKLGTRRVYRPLLAYKMLYDLADKNIEKHWALLFGAKNETVESICLALEQGGEREIVKVFRYIMENYRGDTVKIKNFVSGNQKYFYGRMLKYVVKNIELFY